MRARRLVVLTAALALAAGACQTDLPTGIGGAPVASDGGASAAEGAASAVAEPPLDPVRQAAFDAQARADLAADVVRRTERARRTYGDDVPLRVESGLFVLVGAERGVPFDAAADLAQRALDVYLGSFFARRPDRAVTVYLVRSAAPFSQLCAARFPSGCEGDLGAYSRTMRDIVVNLGPGLPTLTHELVHPLVQTDFPRAPAWFEEGIASLFEKPVFDPPGELHGATNWRYDRLAAALATPAQQPKVHAQALFHMSDFVLDDFDRDLHYAMARMFCQWLDQRGQLWAFYRAWRDGVAGDQTGEKSFAQVTGLTPEEADAPWLEWVKRGR